MSAPGLSVVVMAFNEAQSLEPVVRELQAAAAALGGPYEIVIVDDGSTDGTSAEADRLAGAVEGVRAVHHQVNLGLGGVYRTGFAEARQPWLTFFPADGQFAASILAEFVSRTTHLDMVLGYVEQGAGTPWASFLARSERLLYRVLVGPMPRFHGIFLLRREVLSRLTLRSQGRGWAIVMELIVRVSRAGYRIESVPTVLRPRHAGESKVRNLRTIVSNLRQVAGLRRLL